MYAVFTRDWWKPNAKWPNGLEPYPDAPKTYIAEGIETEGEARGIARQWNATHDKGAMSNKAEVEEV